MTILIAVLCAYIAAGVWCGYRSRLYEAQCEAEKRRIEGLYS